MVGEVIVHQSTRCCVGQRTDDALAAVPDAERMRIARHIDPGRSEVQQAGWACGLFAGSMADNQDTAYRKAVAATCADGIWQQRQLSDNQSCHAFTPSLPMIPTVTAFKASPDCGQGAGA